MSKPNSGLMSVRKTQILPIDSISPPNVDAEADLSVWFHEVGHTNPQAQHLLTAVSALRHSSIPVAFPTETVYGLGADATRSEAVRGIYQAKQRPSDNPLIVHFGSLPQLRRLLQSPERNGHISHTISTTSTPPPPPLTDPIPVIYHPLITAFWPGPLTILLPLPTPSPLAPEVTSTHATFGARMPFSPLARLLISLTDLPLAAPSANASSRPSPTTAAHVLKDLDTRIELILDGGPCRVGVESTVVDGLSSPPAILRPGGIGIEEIRALGGPWADVTVGYQDRKQGDDDANGDADGAPRAPGMKYKHYAPKGRVYLFEAGTTEEAARLRLEEDMGRDAVVGIVRTRSWHAFLESHQVSPINSIDDIARGRWIAHDTLVNGSSSSSSSKNAGEIWSIALSADVQNIAQGLFSALRTLDDAGCEVILIEGISDTEGDLAAAIMNRLRKAAEVDVR